MKRFLTLMLLALATMTLMGDVLHASGLSIGSLRLTRNQGQVIDNLGQLRPDVLFTAQISGTDVYLTKEGISFVLVRQDRTEEAFTDMEGEMAEKMRMLQAQTIAERIDLRFVGMNADFSVATGTALTAVDHFYLGHCPDGITFVPSYSEVTYRDLYPGIDWHIVAKDNQFKTEFIVHAGADPSLIRMEVLGHSGVAVSGDGHLQVQGQNGLIEDEAPVAMQGSAPVAARYALQGPEISFALGAYNPTQTLVIDPYTRVYSTFFGSTGNEWYLGHTTTSDASGNIYLTGNTAGTNFPSTVGSFQSASAGGQDGFIAKLDNAGTRLWCTYYGGNSTEGGIAFKVGLCTDPSGNVWHSNVTSSSNYPVTAGCFQGALSGAFDATLVKLSTAGTRLYATYFGGTGSESPGISRWGANSAPAIASDASGNIFMHGLTQSTNFPVTAGCFQAASGGGTDAFFAKFDNAGARLYATYYGGSANEEAAAVGIAVDNAGNAWMSGCTGSSNFPVTAGCFQPAFAGVWDQYLVKWNNACVRQYSTYYGGNNDEGVLCDVDVTAGGDVWMGVFVQSTNFPITAGAYQTASAGGWEFGAVRFSNAGTRLYSTYFGSSNQEEPWDISVDRTTGRVCLVGATWGSTMVTMGPPYASTSAGSQEGAIVVLDANGFPIYSTYYGSSGHDEAFSSVFDPFGNLWVSGMAGNTPFPVTAGAFQTTFGGSTDPWLAKFAPPVILEQSNVMLRVEEVMGDHVQLGWSCADESQVRGYALERDLGGRWETVHEQAASSLAAYHHTDVVQLQGVVRYRLRIALRDGGEAYSHMVQATVTVDGDRMVQAWPNPVKKGEEFHINYQMEMAGAANLEVSTVEGRLVETRQLQLISGRNHIELPTEDWAAGTYLVRVQSAKGNATVKLVIE